MGHFTAQLADLLIEHESEIPVLHITCAGHRIFSLCRRQFNKKQWGVLFLFLGLFFSLANHNNNEKWQEIKTYI